MSRFQMVLSVILALTALPSVSLAQTDDDESLKTIHSATIRVDSVVTLNQAKNVQSIIESTVDIYEYSFKEASLHYSFEGEPGGHTQVIDNLRAAGYPAEELAFQPGISIRTVPVDNHEQQPRSEKGEDHSWQQPSTGRR